MTLRAGAAAAALCCAILVCVAPAGAFAANWMSEYPFGTTHFQPTVVSVDVFGTTTLSGAAMTIDGVARTTSLAQGPATGHWTSSETLVDGVWRITWTWSADTGGSTKGTLACYPPVLADGTHTVTARVRDASGTIVTAAPWTFFLAEPPAFGALTPAAGAKLATATPAVSVRITDNVAVASVSAIVNGVPAAVGTPAGGVYPVTGFAPLAEGTATVTVTASDPSGNSATKTWTFSVSTVDRTCAACHGTSYATDNAMGPACTACHPDRATPHGYTPGSHTAAFGVQAMSGTYAMSIYPAATWDGVLVNPPYAYGFGCAACHSADLAVEHGKPSSAPVNATVCEDCHPSPRNTIPGAWDKSCSTYGCHTAPGRSHGTTATVAEHAVAASLTAEGPAGGGCSSTPGTGGYARTPCHTTDLVQEHNRLIGGIDDSWSQVPFRTISVSCEECHSSAAFASLGGTWDGTCNGCHPQNHTVAGSARYAEVRAMHQNSRYYDAGYTSSQGNEVEGINAIDAHGPVRTVGGKPYGCANGVCHLNCYSRAGLSSYYRADVCSDCHGPNTAPLTPYQGSHMWSSGALSDGEALTTDLTLSLGSPLPAASSLDFKTYYDIEEGWDYGYVQVSADGGSTWTNLASTLTTTTDPNAQNAGNGITGSSGGWVDGHFDLSAYAGQTVRIRFSYVTDYYTYGEGWYLDTIAVGPSGAPVFTDDVETAKPEWSVTSNSPSAQWTR